MLNAEPQKPNQMVITLNGSPNAYMALCETLGVTFDVLLHKTITEQVSAPATRTVDDRPFHKTLLEIFLERNAQATVSLHEVPLRLPDPADSRPDWESEAKPQPTPKSSVLVDLTARLGAERKQFMAARPHIWHNQKAG